MTERFVQMVADLAASATTRRRLVAVLETIAAGSRPLEACSRVGLPYSTWRNWMRRSRALRAVRDELLARTVRARGNGRNRCQRCGQFKTYGAVLCRSCHRGDIGGACPEPGCGLRLAEHPRCGGSDDEQRADACGALLGPGHPAGERADAAGRCAACAEWERRRATRRRGLVA